MIQKEFFFKRTVHKNYDLDVIMLSSRGMVRIDFRRFNLRFLRFNYSCGDKEVLQQAKAQKSFVCHGITVTSKINHNREFFGIE